MVGENLQHGNRGSSLIDTFNTRRISCVKRVIKVRIDFYTNQDGTAHVRSCFYRNFLFSGGKTWHKKF